MQSECALFRRFLLFLSHLHWFLCSYAESQCMPLGRPLCLAVYTLYFMYAKPPSAAWHAQALMKLHPSCLLLFMLWSDCDCGLLGFVCHFSRSVIVYFTRFVRERLGIIDCVFLKAACGPTELMSSAGLLEPSNKNHLQEPSNKNQACLKLADCY